MTSLTRVRSEIYQRVKSAEAKGKDQLDLARRFHVDISDPNRTKRLVREYQQILEVRLKAAGDAAGETIIRRSKAQQSFKGVDDAKPTDINPFDDQAALAEFSGYLKRLFLSVVLDSGLDETEPEPGGIIANFSAQTIGIAATQAYERARLAGISTSIELEDFVRNVRSANPAEIIATRQYGLLRNMSFDAADDLRDILADGISRGQTPDTIAARITKKVGSISRARARTIALTETTFAHSEATLNAFRLLGIQTVEPMVEFRLQMHGSSPPCPRCIALAGRVFLLSEAGGVIPVHPNCQCGWVPHPPPKRRGFFSF